MLTTVNLSSGSQRCTGLDCRVGRLAPIEHFDMPRIAFSKVIAAAIQ
jgi:hypothetical protein